MEPKNFNEGKVWVKLVPLVLLLLIVGTGVPDGPKSLKIKPYPI